ncbi:tRNA (adenosine(37)-N6)-threonylcarbamoyltransferase complex ATPase subunit type 1 TsaE [Jannaschia sp. Os4]|uniref:tRNA (adenosine(37)-N6)-threonylcarbamoyltransferase complex ATPase subunit type 1 TsaE n=1 Tax=Jannaschia sp. Os4 TaxID=2807617 RepID=UPI001939F465|nr:tRNA (adenosine(37)-N6)-threonylcarbamoyltransferase complex ATPase subunit type 1 TsaE [Jannaschia sp. Os4]MBM2575831.1 tRNA (adenosine(37)-N6)-threonylcarbamoyltransferase complex ATPase subunit type 1 TsaE [Jannaschia sp. Os4]
MRERDVNEVVDLPDADATAALGARLADGLRPGDAVTLRGGLGMGKTHLARACIHALQRSAGTAPEEVPSPTFTLVQTYEVGGTEVWHLDLYRLATPDEAWELGLEEALERAICLIEWPERLGEAIPALDVALERSGDGRRATLTDRRRAA